jgi:diguanylate cyclase (GGDEF)-like protein/putative nucleotidyltransferase with HDIG domain
MSTVLSHLPLALLSLAGCLSSAGLLVALRRQARLVRDHRETVARERALHAEMKRRNEELQALTALATTMTESLEEASVVERGLEALSLAARPTSIALHMHEGGDAFVLRAHAGDWASEGRLLPMAPDVADQGHRQVVTLPVSARGVNLGAVTVLRPADDPLGEEQVGLLRLLADQIAIAIQNARDYGHRVEQAIRDPLTGVYNRRFFYEAFDKELARAARQGTTASLVMIDVDDFKQVNDTLGHNAGDEVLCAIARIANELVRPADSFARVGGEEFALLLPETSQLDALLVSERLRRAIATEKILPSRGVTISAGVAAYPDDALGVEELEAKADGALYWAKRNGKNLCAVAGEVVVDDAEEDLEGVLTHLHALVSTIDSERLNRHHHSENVATYAAALGAHLGLSLQRVQRLRRAALFHDIGMTAVAADLMGKKRRLTSEERAELQSHAAVGARMLLHAGFPVEARWVRHHHERMDGGGYPDGLAGRAIAFESRIIFVADAFEAMTSERPYRDSMSVNRAVEELRACAGTQFDPRVVEALAALLDGGELPLVGARAQ